MELERNHEAEPSRGPKKRVLFIVTQSEMGGAQRFLASILPRLAAERYELLVAAGADGDGELLQVLNGLGIPWEKLTRLRRDIRPFDDIVAAFKVRSLLKRFRPDTLFLCSSKAGFVGSLAGRLMASGRRPKVVYRIGGWSFNDPGPVWKRRLWKLLERTSARWKDIIIVNNTTDLDQAKRFGIRPKRELILVHNGIDPYRIYLLPREEARERLFRLMAPGDEERLRSRELVGTVANLYPTKGFEYLIEAAWRTGGEAIFCIIGDGNERKRLQELITENGLERTVFLLGRMTDASQYLSAFDIFVLPSVKEGLPWALLDAMAAKLPVVATRVGGVPDIIDDGVNGYLVEPRDGRALAEKITAVLDNDLKATEMGIQGHQKILFSFSFDKMADGIERLL